MSFDMNQCKEGDKLISKHGLILTYAGTTCTDYPHRVEYPDGGWGSRTHEGYVYRFNRKDSDHDIVGFAPC